MYNDYFQETAIKISINNLKVVDMLKYIKCELLLKVIISVFYSLFS